MRPRPIHIQLYPVPQFAIYDCPAAPPDPNEFDRFTQLSIKLTGFSLAELQATGMMRIYFEELGLVLGRSIRKKYFDSNLKPVALLSDDVWGPLTRNLIRMWYLGQWKKLPVDWGNKRFSKEDFDGFDDFSRNVDRIISPAAYREGLVWKAVGVNPMGAKEPGFASWVEPPK
jgi:hypothetical protein